MEIKNQINVIRLSIAVFVIFGALYDFVSSFYDNTIQLIASSEKMGYNGLTDFRASAMIDVLLSILYVTVVFLHMKFWRGKFMTVFMSVIDLLIIVLYVLTIFEIV